jgi:hypothetical protein
MRVMVIVKANAESENQSLPAEQMQQMFKEMGDYNEQLVKAGIMLSGEGLQPSNLGKRVRFSGEKRTVIDGPFAETKELVAGFWIWKVKSMDEAIEWARRCPNTTGGESELELRPLHETEDFGAEFTPEMRAQEERLRADIERQQRK